MRRVVFGERSEAPPVVAPETVHSTDLIPGPTSYSTGQPHPQCGSAGRASRFSAAAGADSSRCLILDFAVRGTSKSSTYSPYQIQRETQPRRIGRCGHISRCGFLCTRLPWVLRSASGWRHWLCRTGSLIHKPRDRDGSQCSSLFGVPEMMEAPGPSTLSGGGFYFYTFSAAGFIGAVQLGRV